MAIQGWVDFVNALGCVNGAALGSAPGTPLNWVAQISIGKKGRALNVAPPQYYIFPINEDYGAPQGAGGGGNPRILHTRPVELEFHSMGADFGPTEVLNQALITAIRQVMNGANYKLGRATWVDPDNLEMCPALVLPVTLNFGLPQASLPTVQGAPVGNAVYQTPTVTQVGLDTSGQVNGQNNIVAGSG